MILETAKIEIQDGKLDDFEKAVARGVQEVLTKSKGFVSIILLRGIEEPNTCLLHITWETLEDHTIAFRESDLFPKWREIISPYFALAPQVTHWQIKG